MNDSTVVPTLLAGLILHEVTVLIYMHFLRFEQFGTEHRGQRDSNPSQFFKHDTCHTGQHRHRHEYRYKHEGRRDDGNPHLVGGIDRCLMRILATFDMSGDILQDHNRIIDHHTDSDSQRTEGDDVDRRVSQTEVDKRHNEGNRNRDTNDDGSTPFAEEEEYHEYHEEKGITDGLLQRINGVLDVLRTLEDLLDLHVGR